MYNSMFTWLEELFLPRPTMHGTMLAWPPGRSTETPSHASQGERMRRCDAWGVRTHPEAVPFRCGVMRGWENKGTQGPIHLAGVMIQDLRFDAQPFWEYLEHAHAICRSWYVCHTCCRLGENSVLRVKTAAFLGSLMNIFEPHNGQVRRFGFPSNGWQGELVRTSSKKPSCEVTPDNDVNLCELTSRVLRLRREWVNQPPSWITSRNWLS